MTEEQLALTKEKVDRTVEAILDENKHNNPFLLVLFDTVLRPYLYAVEQAVLHEDPVAVTDMTTFLWAGMAADLVDRITNGGSNLDHTQRIMQVMSDRFANHLSSSVNNLVRARHGDAPAPDAPVQ